MSEDPIEIILDNKEVEKKLQELVKKTSDLKPLMKNIAGIFASAAEDNFAEEDRPDKWQDLSPVTKKCVRRKRNGLDKFFKCQVNLHHQ